MFPKLRVLHPDGLCLTCRANAAQPWSWFCADCNADWKAEVDQAEKSHRVEHIFEGELAVAILKKREGK